MGLPPALICLAAANKVTYVDIHTHTHKNGVCYLGKVLWRLSSPTDAEVTTALLSPCPGGCCASVAPIGMAMSSQMWRPTWNTELLQQDSPSATGLLEASLGV